MVVPLVMKKPPQSLGLGGFDYRGTT